ncbi:hypothetical protein M3P05_02650 [Sansalvadorimonas sp. 2012CJ34-2]|uniref:Ubiquitin-like protease family profile domain-containing protein n=1 Tax=Parendozoicomonas callyspongiae TaxID=2942213 RepID=A0ABT0PBU5_9GAMM|nr:hypothetical protein [Sansalvadorimonas sp. 2012CJ34-2]MCL6268850.1 hypothetical protein [Sansalvadorimonas sp. 2012CJ34-2]
MQVHATAGGASSSLLLDKKLRKKVRTFMRTIKGTSPLTVRRRMMQGLLKGQIELKEGTYIFSGLTDHQLGVKEPMRGALIGKARKKIQRSTAEYRSPCVSTYYEKGTPIPDEREFQKADKDDKKTETKADQKTVVKKKVLELNGEHTCYSFTKCDLETYETSYFIPSPECKKKTDFLSLINKTEWCVQVACKKRGTLPIEIVKPHSVVTLRTNGSKHAPKWLVAHRSCFEPVEQPAFQHNPQLKELKPITQEKVNNAEAQNTGELHLNKKVMCKLFQDETDTKLKFAQSKEALLENLSQIKEFSLENKNSTHVMLVENDFCHTSGLIIRVTNHPTKTCEVFFLETLHPKSNIATTMRELVCPQLREVFSDYALKIVVPGFANQYDYTSCGVIALDWAIKSYKDPALVDKLFQIETAPFKGQSDILTVSKLPTDMMEFYQGEMEEFDKCLLEGGNQAKALKEAVESQTIEISDEGGTTKLNAAGLLDRYRLILRYRAILEEQRKGKDIDSQEPAEVAIDSDEASDQIPTTSRLKRKVSHSPTHDPSFKRTKP